MARPTEVAIHYRRPPDRIEVFRQHLLYDADDVKVTFHTSMTGPVVRIDEFVALEEGSDVVWFTFPGRWHDVGRFHDASGAFTGLYANILTPPEITDHRWETTDLFLDVWAPAEGTPELLDRNEFEHAVTAGWIDDATRLRALEEADHIMAGLEAGSWPPAIVQEWTRTRAHEVLRAG